MPYPGIQAELNGPPVLRGVGLACSDAWPCFWHTFAAPASRQPVGLEVAPALGASAIEPAAAAAISGAMRRATIVMVGTFF